MKKKKIWKKHCALGMALVLASGSVTPALADPAEIQTSESSTTASKIMESASDFDTVEEIEQDSADAEESKSEQDTPEQEPSGAENEEVKQEETADSANGEAADETAADKTDDADDGKNGETADTDEKTSEPVNGTTAGNESVQEPLPVEKELPAPEEMPAKAAKPLSSQNEIKLLSGKTIKVKPGMDLNDALNDALLDEESETPDEWYYYNDSNTFLKHWVKIDGEEFVIAKIWGTIQTADFTSLADYIGQKGNPKVKIGINRTVSERNGCVTGTSIGKSTEVTFTNSAKITVSGLNDHGAAVLGKEIPGTVRYGNDFSFAIRPEEGYVPTLTYSICDDETGEYSDPVELEANEISAGEYSYTINGDAVTDDIKIEVSYEKTFTRSVQIHTDGGKISVNGREADDDEEILITKENCELKLCPQDGYAIASITADGEELSLSNQDFKDYAYIYHADEDSITEDSEPLILNVTIRKAELNAKEGAKEVQWIKGQTAIDDDFKSMLADAVIDPETSDPTPDETDGKLEVTYKMNGSQYKELDYEPKWYDFGHKFGESSNTDDDGNPIETVRISLTGSSRYPDTSIEAEITLKDIRELAKFTLSSSPISYTADRETLKQELYNRILWENGEKPGMKFFAMQIQTGDSQSYKDLDDAPLTSLSVGTKQFKIKFKGNAEYRDTEVEAALEIIKAKASLSVKNKTIIYGEEIPSDLVSVTPADAGVLKLYAGVNSDLDASVCVQLPAYWINVPIFGDIDVSKQLESLLGSSTSINDLLEKLESPEVQTLLELLKQMGIDVDTFVNAFQSISQYLPDNVKSFRVSFGTPEKAGGYTVVAAVLDTNYEPVLRVGSLIILPKTENVEIRWNQDISVLSRKELPLKDDGSFDEENAAELFGAKLYDKESDLALDSSKVRYLYVGMNGEKEFYRGSKPSAQPGVYTQTAYVLSGDNMNWPITRTYVLGRTSAQIQFKDVQMEQAPAEDPEYGTSDTKFAVKRTVYNGEAQTLDAGLYLVESPDTEIDDAKLQYRYYDVASETDVDAPVNAGIYRVTASFEGNGTYSDTAAQTGYLIIEKAQPVFHADTQQTFVYNGSKQHVEIASIDHQDPETEPSVSYQSDGEAIEAPLHAGVYTAVLTLPETANYQAASAEITMQILPARAEIEIRPVSVPYDGEVHAASYRIVGAAGETPEHEVSYSTDEEIYTTEAPSAAGTYTVRIQVTDPDYENTAETFKEVLLIKEAEVLPEEAEARLYIRYLCEDQTVGYQTVTAAGETGQEHVFTAETVSLEIPSGYEMESGFEAVSVPYGKETEVTVHVKRIADPGTGENPGDSGNKPGDSGNKPGDGDNKPGDSGNKPGDGDNKPGDSGNKPGGSVSSSSDSSDSGEPAGTSRPVNGVWRQTEKGIWYSRSNGSYPKNEWLMINGKWFHFDAEGYLTVGWFLSEDGKWYYCDPNSTRTGAMFTGWLHDSKDGNWYYLDVLTGEMATGWKEISKKWYYFNPQAAGESGWKQDSRTNQWIYLQKTALPKGAMYVNSQTPDGYWVDSNGVWQ